MYYELKWRYIEKKLKPVVLIGLVCWVAWIWQLTNAYPELVTPIIITLN